MIVSSPGFWARKFELEHYAYNNSDIMFRNFFTANIAFDYKGGYTIYRKIH